MEGSPPLPTYEENNIYETYILFNYYYYNYYYYYYLQGGN